MESVNSIFLKTEDLCWQYFKIEKPNTVYDIVVVALKALSYLTVVFPVVVGIVLGISILWNRCTAVVEPQPIHETTESVVNNKLSGDKTNNVESKTPQTETINRDTWQNIEVQKKADSLDVELTAAKFRQDCLPCKLELNPFWLNILNIFKPNDILHFSYEVNSLKRISIQKSEIYRPAAEKTVKNENGERYALLSKSEEKIILSSKLGVSPLEKKIFQGDKLDLIKSITIGNYNLSIARDCSECRLDLSIYEHLVDLFEDFFKDLSKALENKNFDTLDAAQDFIDEQYQNSTIIFAALKNRPTDIDLPHLLISLTLREQKITLVNRIDFNSPYKTRNGQVLYDPRPPQPIRRSPDGSTCYLMNIDLERKKMFKKCLDTEGTTVNFEWIDGKHPTIHFQEVDTSVDKPFPGKKIKFYNIQGDTYLDDKQVVDFLDENTETITSDSYSGFDLLFTRERNFVPLDKDPSVRFARELSKKLKVAFEDEADALLSAEMVEDDINLKINRLDSLYNGIKNIYKEIEHLKPPVVYLSLFNREKNYLIIKKFDFSK